MPLSSPTCQLPIYVLVYKLQRHAPKGRFLADKIMAGQHLFLWSYTAGGHRPNLLLLHGSGCLDAPWPPVCSLQHRGQHIHNRHFAIHTLWCSPFLNLCRKSLSGQAGKSSPRFLGPFFDCRLQSHKLSEATCLCRLLYWFFGTLAMAGIVLNSGALSRALFTQVDV